MRHGRVLATASNIPAHNAGRPDRVRPRSPRPAVARNTGGRCPARRVRPALFRQTLRLPGTAHPLVRLVFIIALALLLAAIAPGFVSEPEWIERRVGDLGVPLPAGDGWVHTDRPGEVWVATRVQRDVTGAARTLTLALIEAQTVSASFAQWPPDTLAAQYLQWAIEDLTVDGVETGTFILAKVETGEERHGGRRLHVLRTLKHFIEPWHPDLRLEAQELYLVLLPDFATRPTLYKILLTADCFFEECTGADLDLRALHPLLDGLRVYPAPSG